MNRVCASFALSLALAACSSGESSGTGGSTSSGGSIARAGSGAVSGGSSAAGGVAGSGVATGGGGSSASAGHPNASGGASGSAGHLSTAGAGVMVEPGDPCLSDCPTDDKVEACYGDACPLGECDNSGFLADAQCTDLYPAGVSSSTVYCAAGETGGYCLLTSSKDLSYWAVNCVGGTPQIIYCPNSCGVMNSGASGC